MFFILDNKKHAPEEKSLSEVRILEKDDLYSFNIAYSLNDFSSGACFLLFEMESKISLSEIVT